MDIGILAPEFLPQIGGMPAYAAGVASALSQRDRVTVYTLEGNGAEALPYEQRAVLTRDLRQAPPRLAAARVEVWYLLNAGCLALAPELRRPVVATVHGNDFLSPWLTVHRPWVARMGHQRYWWRHADRVRRTLVRRDIRRGVRAAAHVCAVSEYSRRSFEALHPRAAAKLSVVPPGVDDRYFSRDARDRRAPRGPLRLLTVTRLETWTRRKNVDGILEALAQLGPDHPFQYVVVGDGDDRARLEALARERGIADRVRFAGRVASDELLALYDDADVFVLASKAGPGDIEGFGIVFLEAAAMGLPSICSAEGGATDAVRDGVSGLVLESSSPAAIASGLRRFAAERERFAPSAIRGFAEPFRWPAIAARIRRHLEAAA